MSNLEAADFRALRESLGLSQQDVADASDVRILTVKRWESGKSGIPDDACRWLLAEKCKSDAAVRNAVSIVLDNVAAKHVELTYYRTQEEYDQHGRDEGCFGVANANSRKVAAKLEELGISCSFRYPGESPIVETAKRVTR